ncbi:MAG: YigZ family protein [Coriobacteriales bacterium]|nr:YigZ family protein [Coriobacteriales bacterium]
MQSQSYQTLAPSVEAVGEYSEKRSRFIAQLVHVESEREAQAFVDEVRTRHRDARHNVPAWVLDDGRERYSDDGEPSHTGGLPTLGALHAADLQNVCCVVTRYFGGTLLGPGGLKRAYEAATKAAVHMAEQEGWLVEMTLVTTVTCVVPYAAYGKVEHMVRSCDGRICDTIFGQDVQVTSAFRAGAEVAFVQAMREAASGQDLCVVHEPKFAAF